MNFPTRGIGARSLEQLADAARLYNCSMYAAVPYMTGKAGTNLTAFVRLVEQMRHDTERLTLPEVVARVIDASGLIAHYQTEKEGQDRIENLQELVHAATAFVAEEGYGLDAPARLIAMRPALPGAPDVLASPDGVVDADTPVEMTPLAGFLSHASLEAETTRPRPGKTLCS